MSTTCPGSRERSPAVIRLSILVQGGASGAAPALYSCSRKRSRGACGLRPVPARRAVAETVRRERRVSYEWAGCGIPSTSRRATTRHQGTGMASLGYGGLDGWRPGAARLGCARSTGCRASPGVVWRSKPGADGPQAFVTLTSGNAKRCSSSTSLGTRGSQFGSQLDSHSSPVLPSRHPAASYSGGS